MPSVGQATRALFGGAMNSTFGCGIFGGLRPSAAASKASAPERRSMSCGQRLPGRCVAPARNAVGFLQHSPAGRDNARSFDAQVAIGAPHLPNSKLREEDQGRGIDVG